MLFDISILEKYKTKINNNTEQKKQANNDDVTAMIIEEKDSNDIEKFEIKYYLSDIVLPPKNISWIEKQLKYKIIHRIWSINVFLNCIIVYYDYNF